MRKILASLSITIAVLMCAAFFGVTKANAQTAFTSGNIVICRVSSSAALSGAATAVFLDEYTTNGVFVQTVSLPSTSTTSGNRALTASGTATSECEINLSPDGQFITLGGYNATVGTAGVVATTNNGTAATDVARVVGRVNAAGAVDTTTALIGTSANPIYTANNIRDAVFANSTSALYSAGANAPSVGYTSAIGQINATSVGATGSIRVVHIFGGDLYYNTSTTISKYVGLPTATTATSTAFTTTFSGVYGFVFLDTNADGVVDTLYAADGTSLKKFSVSGTTLTAKGTATINGAVTGLTAKVVGANVVLYASAPTAIQTITDASAATSTLSGTATTLTLTGQPVTTNYAFRGVAFSPTAAATPTITVTPTSLDFMKVVVGNTSTQQSYTVTGTNLSANITVTAPTGYQVSTTSGSGYATTATLPAAGGTIYAIFKPTATGTSSGNITNTSGTTTKNEAVTGMGIASVTLTVAPTSANETNGSFVFTATANSAVSGDQTVSLDYSSGTATRADFSTTLPVTITIPNGQTTVTATVNVLDDTLVEGTETAVFTITPTSTGLSSTTTMASVTIIDNDSPVINSANNTTFTVGTAGSFQVTATNSPTSYAITGTLPNGVTFNTTTGVLSGTPAAGTAGTYPLTFTATNAAGTSPAQNFTLNVVQSTLSVNPTSLSFGSVRLNTSSTLTYTLTGTNLTANVTVTAPSSDYQVSTDGTNFSNSVTVTPTSGSINQTITVKFAPTSVGSKTGNVSNASTNATTQNVAVSGTGIAPDLTISQSAPSTATAGTPYDYTLTVSNGGTADATAISAIFKIPAGTTYNTATVISGGFTASQAGGTVTFSGGSIAINASATLKVTVTPTTAGNITSNGTDVTVDPTNTISESDETNNNAANVSTLVAAAVIPTINVNPSSLNFGNVSVGGTATQNYTVTGTNLTTNITVTAPTGYTVSATSGGTYSSSITLPSSGGTVYVRFSPMATTAYNGNISNASTGATTQNVAVTGTGVQSTVNLTVTPATASEPNGTFTFTATASPAVSGDQTVKFDLTGGTASGADFASFVTSITIPNGATTATKTITINDDLVAEGDETATFTISQPTGGLVFGTQTSRTVTINDNDTAGINVTPTALTLTEGDSSTYSVVLTSQPTSNVTITLNASSQLSTGLVKTLTFTPDNYATAQTVTVTANNDRIANGNRDVTITQTASSADATYNNRSVSTVTVSIVDNDTVGLIVSTTSVDVSEAGITATYTVKLNSQPNGNILVIINGGTQITTDPMTLTFTNKNFDTEQTVTVTAIDDNVDEGAHTQTITNKASATDTFDNGYNAVSKTVTANITDNDTAGVTVSPQTVTVTEGATNETTNVYSVKLNSQPTSDVTIAINAGNQLTTSPTTLTFTAANYAMAQTVTVKAVDDTVIEGTQTVTITQTAASNDAKYNAITVASVSATIYDNDYPSVNLLVDNNTKLENGSFVFTATASQVVVGNQTVMLNLNTGTSATSDDFTPTFTPVTITILDGQTTGTATVAINDDAIVEGVETATFSLSSPSMGIVLGTTTSQPVTITDNDTSTIDLSVSTNSTSEATPNNTVTVTATASKVSTKDQTVTLTVSGTNITTGDYSLNTTTITIPAGSLTGTATFTVLDDTLVEGLETATLTISAPSTGSVIGNATQNIAITDNDKPTVTLSVSANAANASEADKTVVTVTATASDNVYGGDQTVDLTVSGTGITSGDYTLNKTTITIPAGSKTGTATFTIVDDASVEGTETATLTIVNPSSNITIGTPNTQNIVIADNDTASVFVTPTTVNVTEGGATATYSVYLTSQPTSDVTITITTDSQLTTSPTTLTFTPANYATAQTVTVTAVDDNVVEGTHTSTITQAATSSDANYDGVSVPSVTATITDNDFATVTFSASPNQASENGQTVVTLTATSSQAVTGNQTVDLALTGTANAADFVSIPTKITILDGQTSGSVTVKVVDDTISEGDETATFTISNPTGGLTLGTKVSDDVVITDNDKATVNLSVSSRTGLENGTTQITVTATATGYVYGGNQSVTLNTSGTATAGTDYTLSGTTITIPDGQNSTGSVTFTVSNDLIAEGTESAILTIGNATSNLMIGTNKTETISITDDDTTDLSVSVTAPAVAYRYTKFDYVITVHNLSNIDAENVQVNFTLPTGSMFNYNGFKASMGSNFACGNPNATTRTIVCTGGKVAQQSVSPFANTNDATQPAPTITLTVTPQETGMLDNTVSNAVVDPNNVLTETDETNNTANTATSSGNNTTTVSMVTAAGVSASGKVTTAKGRGIAHANVTVLDTTTNETRSIFTGVNGAFKFEGLASGRFYIVTVNAKRFSFDENQQGLQLFEDENDLVFKANR